jgi:DNA modification methylase
MIEIKTGDCNTILKTLDANTFNTCVTSPPYWGLRDYGTATWQGGDSNCSHKRTSKISKTVETITGHKAMSDQGNVVGDAIYKTRCPKCGAIRKDQQLGLEETPEEYVENLVKVFREVWRVLRDDGTVWLNLGDSYYNYRPGKGQYVPKQTVAKTRQDFPMEVGRRANKLKGLKEKDLVGIPWRVAFALQADGWYLRQDIIWHKPNPMPESVKDRCTKAHEYIFLLSKNKKYFYDYEAIKEEATYKGVDRGGSVNRYQQNNFGGDKKRYDTRNKRSVWFVKPAIFKGAHFATFPQELIEPCILAGCPEGGHVLDPFGGAGTTALVAERLSRNTTLIELNKNYVEITKERLT